MKREDDTPQHKAVREALTNSIIHSVVFLAGGILRIEKHDDRLCFRNPGTLKLSLEEIYEGGNSKARNPKMQDILRMIGFGENLGSGFPKIIDAWKDVKWDAPVLEDRLSLNEVRLTLPVPFKKNTTENTTESPQEPPKYHPSTTQVEILVERMTNEYMGMAEIMEVCGMKNRKNFRLNYILPAISDGSIERKYPDQPKHPRQMYRLTEDACRWKNNKE